MNWAKVISCAEKSHYPFKHYPKGNYPVMLFPGCSFSSQLPRTMDALAALCAEHDVGVAYDCCGKTLEGFGESSAAKRVLRGIEGRLFTCGCSCVATVCPNCYYYLRDRLSLPVITVYELLSAWGFEAQDPLKAGMLYAACPDKQSLAIQAQVTSLLDATATTTDARGCCGLMPEIASKGTDASAAAGCAVINRAEGGVLYTYCASCTGQFGRLGCENTRHVLSVALGIDEAPDTAHAFFNRAKRKFG